MNLVLLYMSELPEDLLYTKDHEWVRLQADGTAVVGITDYAQESLGDITFIEFPEIGATFDRGEVFGVVESVKAASDLYMPISGEIMDVNQDVDAAPELVNQDAFAKGWLLKIRCADLSQTENLMKPDEYASII